jgi:hypothetical protein
MFAQTTVTVGDSIRFMTVLDSMKANGGGSIQLSASVKIPIIKNQTYGLESTAANPIQINTNQFTIIANGDGTSADSCFLRIGNYMTITGTGTVISGFKRGHIRVVGGSVTSNTTTSGTSTISSTDGWIFIWGGAVNVNATGLTAGSSAAAVTAGNYMALSIMGGTISATGDYTRAVVGNELGNGVIKPISGATINASGSNAYGIQLIGAGGDTPMYIGNNLTINTSSTDATDVGIINSGSTSLLIIPATVTNLNITSTTNYKLVNPSAVLLDLRGVSITANPVSGATLTYPTNNVVLTATGNSTMTNAGIYYAYSATPTTTSPNITSGASVVAGAATITIKASIGRLGFIDSNVYSFSYTVNNLPANTPINVTTFADLQAAYTTSQTATVDTTRIVLLGSVTNTSAFVMTPDPLHPVVINANNFSLITGANLTLGGALRVYSTTTTGILKLSGTFTTTISGGNYTVYGNAPIIYANSGSGIDNVLAKLYLSNSTFNVYGTSNAASIVKFATSNGNLVSITNCTLNASAKAVAINCIGPLNIYFSGSTINMAGSDATSIAVNYAPTNAAPNTLTFSGLTVNMSAGKVMALAGSKALNTIVKDLTVSSMTPTLYAYTGTGVSKFYDFRAYTPTVDVAPGNYSSNQTVTPSLTPTAILPVDAGVATFVYTLDGSDPILTSSTTTPVSIGATTTLKMAAKSADGLFLGKIYSFAYSIGTTAVASLQDNSGISVYPTVVENTVTVNQMAKHIFVMDLAGKLVLEKSNASQFDMSSIKAGVYLVKIQATDNSARTIKVVKL